MIANCGGASEASMDVDPITDSDEVA